MRLALVALEDDSTAASAIGDRQLFFAEEDGVRVRARRRGAAFDVLDSRQEDGSWVKSDERAIAEVVTVLRRRGIGPDEVARARRQVEAAPRGVRVNVAPGLVVRKSKASSFLPDLSAPLAPDACFLAAAYLFLALHLGRTTYHSILQPIRDVLRGAQGPRPWTVTPLFATDRGYQSWHGLCLRPGAQGLQVEIRLFGVLSWMVSFAGIAISAGNESWVYRVELDTGCETWQSRATGSEVTVGA